MTDENTPQTSTAEPEKKRSMLKTLILVVVGLALVVFVGIQFKTVDRSNPPVTQVVDAPPEVMAILKRSCFDCHSNETVWPWYSRIAPISWRVAGHVDHGRKHVNFSTWDEYDAEDRADIIHESYEEAEEGHMPLPDYLRMHPEAALSAEDIEVLRIWAGE